MVEPVSGNDLGGAAVGLQPPASAAAGALKKLSYPPVISPQAVVAPGAKIGPGCRIEAFAVISDGVELGDFCVVEPHAVIHSGVRAGKRNSFGVRSVIGGLPQSRSVCEVSGSTVIGDDNSFHEAVTVHRGNSQPGNTTLIGNNNIFMVGAHVAHDVQIGDNNTFVNGVMLAGHVIVGDGATLSADVKVQQWSRIGDLAMISGNSIVFADVPPYLVAHGANSVGARLISVNEIALRRAGFSAQLVGDIKSVFRQAVRGGDHSILGNFAAPELVKLRSALESPSKNGLSPALKEHSKHLALSFEKTRGSGDQRDGFCNIAARHATVENELLAAWQQIVRRGDFISGPEVAEFEHQICKSTGSPYCLSCANGTDALTLALLAKGVGPGDAVVVPAFTFVASASAICRTGAIPVFADIDESTLNISAESAAAAIDKFLNANTGNVKIRGIVAVNIFGQPCEYDALHALAKQHGLFILEDAAQSFGAKYKGRASGTLGELSTFSFFPSKPLGGFGDGGAVLCHDQELAKKIAVLRNHGLAPETDASDTIGLNSRLDTLNAAGLLIALKNQPDADIRRSSLAMIYRQALDRHFDLQLCEPHIESANAQFAIKVREDLSGLKREHLVSELKRNGFVARTYYSSPLHLQPAFRMLGYKAGDLPTCESVAKRMINLPIDPFSISLEQQESIIRVLTAGE